MKRAGSRTLDLLIPLEDVGDGDLALAGGKALGLAKLIRAGLPVPPGFCLTTEAFRLHLDACGVCATAKGSARSGAAAAGEPDGASLRKAIIETAPSREVNAAIERACALLTGRARSGTAPLLAVRSSAVAEDLPERSFAGQHLTVLGVLGPEACLDAVRRCWASLYGERAIGYRERAGMGGEAPAMGVVLQLLVPAEVSGVLFTVDPTGWRDRIVLEASPGLGEAIVSGRVEPDRIVFARRGLEVLERRAGRKALEFVAGPGGGVEVKPLDAARGGALSIGDGLARRLAGLGIEAERALGAPADVEWAVAAGEPFLLQARPITRLAESLSREGRQVWSNVNTGEVAPDVASPMTWSLLEPLVRRLIGAVFAQLGMKLASHPLVGLVAGRIYFNLNTILAFMRRIPGIKGRSLAEIFGGRKDLEIAFEKIPIPEEDLPDLGAGRLKVALRLPGLGLRFLFFSADRAGRILEELRENFLELERIDLAASRDEEVIECLLASHAKILGAERSFRMVSLAPVYQMVLYDLCRRWFGEEGNGLAGRLLAGLGNQEAADAGLELVRLGRTARKDARVEAALLGCRSLGELRGRIEGFHEGGEFIGALEAFLRDHGHHCRGEIEVLNARWSEEPERVLDLLRVLLRTSGEGDLLDRHGRIAADRRAALARCRRLLRNPLRRLVFEFVLAKAERCTPLRENLKSIAVRWVAATRKVLLELGGRMARRGVLASGEDVFFLQIGEVADALRSAPGRPGSAAATVTARRAEYEKNLPLQPPPVVAGKFEPGMALPETPEPSSNVLTGLSIHPGLVSGRARVILREGDGEVLPGEILVAPFTDPGWTPYLLNAAAVIVDMGGLLSHGSIIAREYGIPTVVNVGPATRLIRTGQLLEVDAGRGIVRILE